MNAELFRKLCDELSVTATQIADACGLNRNTIGRWLKGANPTLSAAYAVAEYLGTDVLELFPAKRSKQ